jgi:hypothetical protein
MGAFPHKSPKKDPSTTALDAAKTVREAEATWLQFLGLEPAGLYGGSVGDAPRGFTLTNYSLVRGVRVSGTVNIKPGKFPLVLSGKVRVSGSAAALGSLRISGRRVSGTLGGRKVSAKL